MAKTSGFQKYQGSTIEAVDVSASDFTPGYSFVVRAAGGAGSISVVTSEGDTAVITNVGDPEYIPVVCKQVNTSGTTYTGDIFALS
jgi:hypothetical protein